MLVGVSWCSLWFSFAFSSGSQVGVSLHVTLTVPICPLDYILWGRTLTLVNTTLFRKALTSLHSHKQWEIFFLSLLFPF